MRTRGIVGPSSTRGFTVYWPDLGGEPQFADRDARDYHLSTGSPCRAIERRRCGSLRRLATRRHRTAPPRCASRTLIVILTDDQRSEGTMEAMPKTVKWFHEGRPRRRRPSRPAVRASRKRSAPRRCAAPGAPDRYRPLHAQHPRGAQPGADLGTSSTSPRPSRHTWAARRRTTSAGTSGGTSASTPGSTRPTSTAGPSTTAPTSGRST